MIGYSCKYAPPELIAAYGGQALMLDAETEDFSRAETLTHANVCCHAKALLTQALDIDELVLTDCCDATRRTYDVLQAEGRQRFLFQFDLPHDDAACARTRLAHELMRFADAYGAYTGAAFSRETFLSACRDNSHALLPNEPFIAVLGARVSPQLLGQIRCAFPIPAENLTCSGLRTLEEPPKEAADCSFEALMDWYAGALLRQTPCMRMTNIASRRALYENENIRGIVYNTVKFCDYYGFEYAELKAKSRIPLLKIESDYTVTALGQLATRLEAFRESLGLTAKPSGAEPSPIREPKTMNKHFFAGIDSGSTTTNMVVLDESETMLAFAIVRTGPRAQMGAQAALEAVCKQLNIGRDDFAAIVATGYGRNNIPFATDTKTEITCHARGAHFINPAVRTIIDIGGQDSKVINLDESGHVTGFMMNDKCAAGTGRFLEMMARTLELDMAEMSRRGLTWDKELTISSMCTVFAESEVISLIADNHTDSDIIHGLNKSIAGKTAAMAARAKGQPPYMMTGGVARNRGVVQALEEKLGAKLFISENPDLCGALGAALFALHGD